MTVESLCSGPGSVVVIRYTDASRRDVSPEVVAMAKMVEEHMKAAGKEPPVWLLLPRECGLDLSQVTERQMEELGWMRIPKPQIVESK